MNRDCGSASSLELRERCKITLSRRSVSSIPRVLITGGTGFVGSAMRRTQPDIQAFYLNRKDYQEETWPVTDYIVHLANIDPTRVLTWARTTGARLLYCSSGAAYDRL